MGTIIENKVSLQGSDEEIRRFKEFMKSGLSCFDFNNVIKMPVELHEVQNEMGMKYLMLKSKMVFTREEYELVTSFEKLSEERKEELLDTGRAALMNIINYDFPTWYEWAIYNWGTKSNAEDAYSEGDEFFFETELTPPYLVYRKLDELFPDLTIEYSYFNDALDDYMTIDKEIIENPFEVNLYAVKEPKKFLMWD